MFPPSLYHYVINDLRKQVILVLNKIDLAAPEVIVAWKHYFESEYKDIHIVLFTSYPGYNMQNASGWTKGNLSANQFIKIQN